MRKGLPGNGKALFFICIAFNLIIGCKIYMVFLQNLFFFSFEFLP